MPQPARLGVLWTPTTLALAHEAWAVVNDSHILIIILNAQHQVNKTWTHCREAKSVNKKRQTQRNVLAGDVTQMRKHSNHTRSSNACLSSLLAPKVWRCHLAMLCRMEPHSTICSHLDILLI